MRTAAGGSARRCPGNGWPPGWSRSPSGWPPTSGPALSVSLAPGQYAQLDDVLVTRRGLPGRDGIQISGVVTNVEAVHEGARFASDVFLIEQGASRPRQAALLETVGAEDYVGPCQRS
jgi:hypothetical protein